MTTIAELKEQTVLETPLLLFECQPATDKVDVQYWSTHRVQYEGQNYDAVVMRHNFFEMSASSEEGIDAISRISLSLANADSRFSKLEWDYGWKGARVTARFLFFDLKNGTPASDNIVVFRGIANPPDEISTSILRLTFTNRLGLQRLLLPHIRIQKRCPWTFPTNDAQREEAKHGGLRGRYSPFFGCGYSPGGDAENVGNFSGDKPFASCDYTRTQCEERGMFSSDQMGRSTRRFGGIEFLPANTLVRSYGEQGSHVSATTENEARYNDFVPLVYGTAWYQPPIVFARNDGNLTRMEVLLGMGEMEGVVKVIVNGIDIPQGISGTDMTATGWFNIVSYGNRTGNFNAEYRDKSGKYLGDPYGNMAYMSVVVPNRVSDGRGLPRVEVLAHGLKLEQFDLDGEQKPELYYTNNPAWVLLDLLRRCGWQSNEINFASFAQAAVYCDELIDASDLHGNQVNVPRYQCNLVVRKRRSATDLVRGVRNGSGLYITYGLGGLLELRVEGSFAIQQSIKPIGSNSKDEWSEGGWPAYEFGDKTDGSTFSGLLARENGEPSLRFWCRSIADTPNRYSIEFQDEFNEFQQDSLSLVHTDDALSTGQEVSSRLNALGIPNFSQASRMLRRQLSKGIEGNIYAEFETSVRGVGLRPGDLITLTYFLKEGLQRWPFRIVKLAPGQNFRTLAITCQLHDDSWYSDQTESNWGTRRRPRAEGGLPHPLADSFEIAERSSARSDGTIVITLTVGFVAPNKPEVSSAGIPLLSLAPGVDNTGGRLPGGTYYYAISGLDANGAEGGLSFLVRARVEDPEGRNTNRVTLHGLSFSPETQKYHVYRGTLPSGLLRIGSDVEVTPERRFEDVGFEPEMVGPPDENYDHANFYWRLEAVPPYPVTQFSPNTIGSDNESLSMQEDEHVGLAVRITKGKGAGQERTVVTNDRKTLTVSPPWETIPDLTSEFVVAESGWRTGASGPASPIQFDVPNREWAVVHVLGRSVNAQGRECAYELSPQTRYRINGQTGTGPGDIDVPVQPTFSLRLAGQGTVEVESIGFPVGPENANILTIQGATLTVHYWNELKGETSLSLTAPLAEGEKALQLSGIGHTEAGTVFQIGSELLVLEGPLSEEQSEPIYFERGSFGTIEEPHEAGTRVYPLERKAVVIPFVKDFFGSRASGSFGYPIFLPDLRIAAAELFMTNALGNSETKRVPFTRLVDLGLRTLSGGQLSIQVEGYLAIQTGVAPPLVIEQSHSVRDVFAVLSEAPVGGSVVLRLLQRLDAEEEANLYCTLTIPASELKSNTVYGRTLPPLREGAQLTLDIVTLPDSQTPHATPGADLTVTIRL